jgi:hypothetical protein
VAPVTADRIPAAVLTVYDATGATALGQLGGYESIIASEVLSDSGSLQLAVPRNVAGVSLIDTDDDWQLKLSMAGVPPMWFVSDDDDSTWISDDPVSETVTFKSRSLHAVLDEAPIGPDGGIGAAPASWTWETGPTPGKVVADVFAAAQAHGWLQNLTLDGNALTDAAGDAWPDTLPDGYTHPASTTVFGVLSALRDALLLEYRIVDRTVQIYRYGGALDRSPDVTLRPGRDVEAAPIQRSRRAVATAAIVEGAGGETALRTQSLPGRRARAVYVTESDLDIGGAAEAAADLYLAAHAEADVQYTHDLVDGDDTPRPWIDYRPGDRVRTMAVGLTPARRRVQQIALSMSGDGVKVSLELGSILRSSEEIMAKKLGKLRETAVS